MALARELIARGQPARVINADSTQVYADLKVLSARPGKDEMQGVEHRLFGAWDGSRACSAADWATAARDEVSGAHAAGIVPIVVGGTGLYIRTLLDGIAPIPPIDPDVRARVRALPVAEAYAELMREDPVRAQMLNPGDTARVARALEVALSTGYSLAHWQARRFGGIGRAVDQFPLVLLPPRDWLFERCDARFAAMVEQGAVGEVVALIARRLDPELPVMRAIGVREIAGCLRGEWTQAHAVALGQQATRHYAKRQYTWFSHQPPESWPRVNDTSIDVSIFETLFRYLHLT